ncbi:MAG: hypothetical protein OEW75_07665 [Cyclobacteriaceae bacterium]|nr:hypothetical protein [Cyclobacteriaceae bacterium]
MEQQVKTSDVEAVSMSFGRACIKGDIIGRFYEIFLESHPAVKPMFKNTDFDKQKGLLKHGVNLIILYAKGSSSGVNGLTRIRDTHKKSKMNIDPRFYSYWKKSFIKAIKEYDSMFTPELEQAWTNVIEKGIEYISSGYFDN